MVLIPVNGFLGERNTVNEKSLPLGALSESSNVDIDNEGFISSRDGFTLSQAFSNITASFTTSDERRMFIIESGELKFVNEDFTTYTIKTGMPTGYVKWLEVADYVIMSTGHIITKDLEIVDWRIPTPDQVSMGRVSGNLPAGQYQVVSTYRDFTGREGAASFISVIDVADDSALAVTPSYLAGYETIIYVTDTNGEVLYQVGVVPDGSTATIADTSMLVYPIDKQQLDAAALPEQIGSLAFYESSVWASQYIDGVSYLWKSKPYWWHLFDAHEDYLAIQGKVTVIEGTPQGLFIGTDDEMYVYTIEDSLVRLAEYGVVGGKPLARADNGRLFVWTKQGVCTLFPFENITEDKLSLPPGCICSTAIIERKGYEQFMVLNNGSGIAFNSLT